MIVDPWPGLTALADASNIARNDRSLLMENLQLLVIIVENLTENQKFSLWEKLCLPF